MNYLQMFRQLFSFGAHASLSASPSGGDGVDAKAIFAELERHITAVRMNRKPGNTESFDSAWFAVSAWLDEKLAAIRAAAGNDPNTRLQRRFFNTVNAGEEFFTKLDVLLDEQNTEPTMERADSINLYGACIDLGFLGKYYLPEDRIHLDEYRQRCNEACAQAYGDAASSNLLQSAPVQGSRSDKPVSMLVFWVVPAVVTLGLFVLYRLLLSSIYGQVVK